MSSQLRRWEPFREMVSLRDAMDRLFDESFLRPVRVWQEGGAKMSMDIDMYQTDKDVVVKAALPGVKPDEVDITVTGDTLTIKGEHKEEREEKQEGYVLKERSYGSFYRTLSIPVPVRSDKIDAVFDNGVLTLTMPKEEAARPKQIKVKPKAAIEEPKKKSETKAS